MLRSIAITVLLGSCWTGPAPIVTQPAPPAKRVSHIAKLGPGCQAQLKALEEILEDPGIADDCDYSASIDWECVYIARMDAWDRLNEQIFWVLDGCMTPKVAK